MISERKKLNSYQTELRQVMTGFDRHKTALRLFLAQHGRLHAGAVSGGEVWSYPDEILFGLDEGQLRRVLPGREHSVAWCVWHIARIEDVTMNILVAGRPQLFRREDWAARLASPIEHTGNAMSEAEVAAFSEQIDLAALLAYRTAVGLSTREIVAALPPEALKEKVNPTRLQRLWDEDAVHPDAGGIIDYWSRRNLAGLLLMPATRHNLVHLNEAARLGKR